MNHAIESESTVSFVYTGIMMAIQAFKSTQFLSKFHLSSSGVTICLLHENTPLKRNHIIYSLTLLF